MKKMMIINSDILELTKKINTIDSTIAKSFALLAMETLIEPPHLLLLDWEKVDFDNNTLEIKIIDRHIIRARLSSRALCILKNLHLNTGRSKFVFMEPLNPYRRIGLSNLIVLMRFDLLCHHLTLMTIRIIAMDVFLNKGFSSYEVHTHLAHKRIYSISHDQQSLLLFWSCHLSSLKYSSSEGVCFDDLNMGKLS
jgi:integrase